jgi:hypothetical protein
VSAIRRAVSQCEEPADVARELAEQLDPASLGSALLFCSSRYDLGVLQAELAARLAGVDLVGCTTAGEISPYGYGTRSAVAMGFPADDYIVVADRVDELEDGSMWNVYQMVRSLLRRLRVRAPNAGRGNTVAVLLIDGLSGREEAVLSAITMELGDIPLVGGSAGDDERFVRTHVLHEGTFTPTSAVLVLIHTDVPFEVFKTQHVRSTGVRMVVTGADPGRRVVTEINAEPAAREYARLCGVSTALVRSRELALHPLVVRVGGENYARTIQSVNQDESLTFFCAIDEGIVMSSALSDPIAWDIQRLFERIRQKIGQPQAVLGFDCLFRRLTLQEQHADRRVSEMFAANNVIGFSTYGEQYNAMHLNLTFTGVAFGDAGAA